MEVHAKVYLDLFFAYDGLRLIGYSVLIWPQSTFFQLIELTRLQQSFHVAGGGGAQQN